MVWAMKCSQSPQRQDHYSGYLSVPAPQTGSMASS
jgi:hypothetical protein